MFFAFRYPMLGLGEWGDAGRTPLEVARYRQLETSLAARTDEH